MTRVTVVERDPAVIRLMAEVDVFGQLPPEAAAKVEVVEADALEWRPEAPVDFLLADIWLPLMGEGRFEESARMVANTGAARAYVWGQELEIARRANLAGIPLDRGGVERVIAESGLPLVGLELPDYPSMIARAAEHCPGTKAPA